MTAAATSLLCAPPKSCVVKTHQKSIYCQTQVDADFVNFTIGQPTPRLLPLEELRSSLSVQLDAENADPLMIQYGGTSTQLDVLARWLAKKLEMEVACSELILTNGNSHGIQFAARALCAPGDSLLMDDPTYFLVGDILQSHCKVAVLPCTVSEDFTSESDESVVQRTSLTAGMTRFVDALEAYLEDDSKPKPKAIYTIPVHHNPTAGSFSVAAAKKLVALAQKYNFYIFADEPYVLLNHELQQGVEKNKNREVGGSLPDDLQPIRTSLRYYDIVTDEQNRTTPGRHVISMGSFSKIIAPGLRLGWLHAHADVVANHFTKDPVIASGGGVNPVSSLTFTLVHNLLAITTANSASSPASAAGEGAARSAPSIVEAGAKYVIEPRSNEQVNSIDAGSALANSQPIFFDDAALLFNGEIYNYRDLLYEHLAPDEDHDNIISDGGSTKNNKPTLNEGEVLIRLYRQLGAEFVKHLDGEFALAVLDFRERKLLFSADVFGTKPLWL
eukprot:g3140.t1